MYCIFVPSTTIQRLMQHAMHVVGFAKEWYLSSTGITRFVYTCTLHTHCTMIESTKSI